MRAQSELKNILSIFWLLAVCHFKKNHILMMNNLKIKIDLKVVFVNKTVCKLIGEKHLYLCKPLFSWLI